MILINHSKNIENHIQTLRAFSVISVFLYHTNLNVFSYGYLGVDIFFLISGYVISKRIFEDYEITKKIDLYNFYSKRIKRIIPNLFFIVIFTYIFYLVFGPPDLSLFKETIFALFGLSNLYYINYSRDYFNNVFEDPLGHTWSLGVEEQFYIVFPVLIFLFLNKKNNYNNLIITLSTIFIISLIFFSFNFKDNQLLSFYFSPYRFWEFLIGTFFYLYRKKIKFNKFIFYLSIFFIFILIFGNLNINLGFFLNIIILLMSGYIISSYKKNIIFENNQLIYLGNISYSFYLCHLPILFFSDLYITSNLNIDLFFSFILTILFSVFTYNYIEQKFRFFTWKPIFYINIALVVLITLAALAYIKYFNDNLRSQLRNFVYELNYIQKNYNWNNRVIFRKNLKINEYGVYDYCGENSKNFQLNKFDLRKECLKQKNFKKIFFLFGNSHSAQFLPLLTNSKYIDNIYFLHLKKYKFPDSETINKLINSYEEIYFITNISNKENFEKIKNSYERYKTSQTKLFIFNSTPYVTRNEPFKCFIQRKDCFVEKDKKISERKLDNLFENFIEYKSKNLNNFFIFNSFGSLCKNNKCPIYVKKTDTIIFRDRTHLTYEGVSTLLNNFNKFLIDKKLTN
jgi:peptidoglycan/LPS O-acetylase OafA/YrhL